MGMQPINVIFWDTLYKGESKALPYFDNMRHNLAVSHAFVEIVNVTNSTGLWDSELAWYSPRSATPISLYGLEHGVGDTRFSTYLTLPDRRRSCNSSKISRTICSLYSDRLCL